MVSSLVQMKIIMGNRFSGVNTIKRVASSKDNNMRLVQEGVKTLIEIIIGKS